MLFSWIRLSKQGTKKESKKNRNILRMSLLANCADLLTAAANNVKLTKI